jgi:hypothetical protein
MAGTSATLLAKRFESALLVNVDNITLSRLMANEQAMKALMNIEGFRSLNKDIETIINISETVKKAKSKDEKLSSKEKKLLTDQEKEYKSKRKLIQDKLIKFATRIPIFMYLTDYREYSLKDVITQLESGLFKKVTGLDVKDFELLVSLGVFNGSLMNDAVYKFKRYEDSSLSYTGVNKHEGQKVGGFDTVLSFEEYQRLYEKQQDSRITKNNIYDNKLNAKLQEEMPKKRNENYQSINIKLDNYIKETNPPSIKELVTEEKIIDSKDAKMDSTRTLDYKVSEGQVVVHKVFGEGEVISIAKGRIIIAFGKSEKMFMYPDAFKLGFLTVKL